MLLQFKLHFTSLLPSSHAINAALFTTTVKDFAGLPPLKPYAILPWIILHCGYEVHQGISPQAVCVFIPWYYNCVLSMTKACNQSMDA